MSGKRQLTDVNADDSVIQSYNKVSVIDSFDKIMVDLGSHITELTVYGFKTVLKFIITSFKTIGKKHIPVHNVVNSVKIKSRKTADKIACTASDAEALCKKFASRVSELGFKQAVFMQASEFAANIRKTKKFYTTIINYAVPAICIAVLVNVVTDIKARDYGVTVECNGQELGVISTEDVLDDAQQVLSDRVTYYDIGSDAYVNAQLTVTAISSDDEVLDETTLANAMEQQIPEQQIAAYEFEQPQTDAADTAGLVDTEKVRAFPVTVDGEMIGAVADYSKIDTALSSIKSEYENEENVIEVSFDKNIEYGYEQYVDPASVVEPQVIVDTLTGIVTQPVYYEVKMDDTPWDIAMSNDMSVDELKQCTATFDGEIISDITADFRVGTLIQLSEEVPYLEPTVTKDLTYTTIIDYEIEKTEDDNLYKGDTKVDVEGVEGEKKVHALVTYKNGKITSNDVLEETIISEPVTKKIRVGTRKTVTPVSTGSGGSGNYFWPVGGGYISAYFGDGRGHKGIDIAAPYGTPIYASESGTVTDTGSGWNGGYGNCIQISQTDGNVTVYAHQSSLAVNYGDYVVKGQLIGYVGSTGDSTGNHLHYEVRSSGQYLNPTDYVSQ